MEKNNSHILHLAVTILGLTAVVSLIVLVVGLALRWNTQVQFSNGFFIAGALVIVSALFSLVGGFRQRADFSMTYAETAGQASMAERTQRMMADIHQRYGFMVVLVGVGILLMGISILLGQFS
jgi:hypothetical protein